MKIIKSILLLKLCLMAVLSNAQNTPCPRPTNPATDMICDYSAWDWENTNPYDPLYCKTWTARVDNNFYLSSIGSPFVEPVGQKLNAIRENGDYTKSTGWVLVKRDFGCTKENLTPYFILYNKYTALLRIYTYLNDAVRTNYNGIVMTLKPNESERPAIAASAQPYLKAPDKYLNNSYNTEEEIMVYVSDPNPIGNWVVGEFLMTFDPNFTNQRYVNTDLEFSVYGLIESEIKADIVGTGKTEALGFNTTGTAIEKSPDGLTRITAKADKAVAFLDKATDLTKKVNSSAKQTLDFLQGTKSPVLADVMMKAGEVFSKTSKIAKGIPMIGSYITAAVEGAKFLKFIGTSVGLLSKDENAGASLPAVAPTVTSFDLKVSGTIKTRLVLERRTLKIPGTVHTANINNPYYNCGLGIFNISKTPVLEVIEYDRFVGAVGTNSPTYCGVNRNYTQKYRSYRVKTDDVLSIVNSSSELELVSVEAAIIGEVNSKYDLLENPYSNTPQRHCGRLMVVGYDYKRNPMLADLEAGRIDFLSFDPTGKNHVIQTPYVSLNCFQGMTFNVRAETDVFVRIKAILKKKGSNDNTPVYYIKDYLPDVVAGTNPTNLNYANIIAGALPPYTNYTVPVSAIHSDATIKNVSYPQPFIPQYCKPTGSGKDIMCNRAGIPLSNGPIPQQSGVIQDVTHNLKVESTVFNPANAYNLVWSTSVPKATEEPFILRAGNIIHLGAGTVITRGANFAATTNYGFTLPSCGTRLWATSEAINNCYDNSALREEMELASQLWASALNVSPNPSSGKINVQVSNDLLGKDLYLYDIVGNKVMTIQSQSIENGSLQLDISDRPSGIYVLKSEFGDQKAQKIYLNK